MSNFKDGRGEDGREMQDIEIELPDKIRALELLGKHLGPLEPEPQEGGEAHAHAHAYPLPPRP